MHTYGVYVNAMKNRKKIGTVYIRNNRKIFIYDFKYNNFARQFLSVLLLAQTNKIPINWTLVSQTNTHNQIYL